MPRLVPREYFVTDRKDATSSDSKAGTAANSASQEEHREPSPKPVATAESKPSKSLVNKVISRCSSIDSQYSGPPRSPFQSNPLLTAHDYAKSPLMEGLEDVTEEHNEDITNEAVVNGDVVEKSEEPMHVDNPEVVDLTNKPDFDAQNVELNEPLNSFSPKDLVYILRNIETDIFYTENRIRDEGEKKKKHRTDDCRRVHNYDEFITSFLAMLLEQNMLGDLVQQSLGKAEKSKEVVKGKDGKTKKQGLGKGQLKTKTKKKSINSDSDLSDSAASDNSLAPATKIMYKDPKLPQGWSRKVSTYQNQFNLSEHLINIF